VAKPQIEAVSNLWNAEEDTPMQEAWDLAKEAEAPTPDGIYGQNTLWPGDVPLGLILIARGGLAFVVAPLASLRPAKQAGYEGETEDLVALR
jgi:hypothetical protein